MKIPSKTVSKWRNKARDWLALEAGGLRCDQVVTGRDAWTVAHRCGITQEAYNISRDIVDAHIQTALEKIFPNATFNDPKRY